VENVEADKRRIRTGHPVQVTDVPSWCRTKEHGILQVAEDQIGSEKLDTASFPIAHLVTKW